MRITSCNISYFGTLEERRIDDLDHGLVVILGPNEAGKSTFFHFLTTMLFGYSPADASNHPYAAAGKRLSGTMSFVAGNTSCTVERTLKSTPRGELQVGLDGLFGRTEKLRNRPLPELTAVSRDLFESVYALTLADMVSIQGKSWDTIQDRLLGGLNMDQLRNPREVVAELEIEAKKLWRPDRRGKTRSGELREKIRSMRVVAREARERDRSVRQLVAEVRQLSDERESLEAELRKDRISIRTTDRLLPVKLGLERVESLKSDAGDLSRFDEVPNNPSESLTRLRAARGDLENDLASIQESLSRLTSVVEAHDDSTRNVANHSEGIRSIQTQVLLFGQRRSELESLSVRLRRREAALVESARRLLGNGGEESVEAIREIPLSELRGLLRNSRTLRDEAQRSRARDEGAALASPPKSVMPWVVLSTLGVVTALAGFVVGEPAVWGPALAVASVGIALLLQGVRIAKQRGSIVRSPSLHVVDLERQLAATADGIARCLGQVKIPRSRWESQSEDIVDDVHAIQSCLREIDELRSAIPDMQAHVESDHDAIRSLAMTIGISETIDVAETVNQMVERLSVAQARASAALHASAQIESEEERVRLLTRRLERTTSDLNRLESILERAGAGDVIRGSAVIEERRSFARRAAGIREDLENRFPDLEELTQEISAMNGAVRLTDEARTLLDQRIETTRGKIKDLSDKIARAETRIDALREERTVSDIESEIALMEEDNARVCRERDRLMLLAAIIRDSDLSFRERHQPDVVKRASSMLSTLTSGRYDRIEVKEDDDQLVVHDTVADRQLVVGPPLSRGTLDQIYLSLRLAISEHLDDPRDPLPIFLDEVLVNWDKERRRNAYRMLGEMSDSRQMFFFTCHEWLADELKRSAGGHVIDI